MDSSHGKRDAIFVLAVAAEKGGLHFTMQKA
jgi:hypothetical protein